MLLRCNVGLSWFAPLYAFTLSSASPPVYILVQVNSRQPIGPVEDQ